MQIPLLHLHLRLFGKYCAPARISREEHTICSAVQGGLLVLLMSNIGRTISVKVRTFSCENLYLCLNKFGFVISSRGFVRNWTESTISFCSYIYYSVPSSFALPVLTTCIQFKPQEALKTGYILFWVLLPVFFGELMARPIMAVAHSARLRPASSLKLKNIYKRERK